MTQNLRGCNCLWRHRGHEYVPTRRPKLVGRVRTRRVRCLACELPTCPKICQHCRAGHAKGPQTVPVDCQVRGLHDGALQACLISLLRSLQSSTTGISQTHVRGRRCRACFKSNECKNLAPSIGFAQSGDSSAALRSPERSLTRCRILKSDATPVFCSVVTGSRANVFMFVLLHPKNALVMRCVRARPPQTWLQSNAYAAFLPLPPLLLWCCAAICSMLDGYSGVSTALVPSASPIFLKPATQCGGCRPAAVATERRLLPARRPVAAASCRWLWPVRHRPVRSPGCC